MPGFSECNSACTRIPRERVFSGGGSRKRQACVYVFGVILMVVNAPNSIAQTCIGQTQPLQPASAVPLAPLCICTQTNNCHWTWVQVPQNTPQIPIQQWNQPAVVSPSLLDLVRQAEEIKQLRLQNQILENGLTVLPAITPTTQRQIQPAPLSELRQPNSDGLSRTDGSINGWAWQMLPDAEKAGYLMGVTDGLGWVARTTNAGTRDFLVASIPGGLIVNEIEAAVDHFYTEIPNLPIPVISAMHIIALKALGLAPEEIQKQVASDRLAANAK